MANGYSFHCLRHGRDYPDIRITITEDALYFLSFTTLRLTNPPGIPGLPWDLTYDSGIQGFAKVCFGRATL